MNNKIISSRNNNIDRHTIQVKDALQRITKYISPLPSEEVVLEDAFGRYLAVTVSADHPLPHFRRSGMDGFSIRAEDIRFATLDNPVILKVVDTIPSGSLPSCAISRGQASRTMTGAMVPEGANAVIMLEMTQELVEHGEPYIRITKSIPAGTNISDIGSELREGELVLKSGQKISAGEIALLASFGYDRVPVYRRPKAAIIATGSELLEIAEPLVPGKIRNSNLSMLAAQVKQYGGEPIALGTASDDIEEVSKLIDEAFQQADIVITTGGVSVGDYDIVSHIFSEWKQSVLFNKLAMRPGSVTSAALKDEKLILGLSGNPGACFVAFELLVRPVLLGMQGERKLFLPECTAYLANDFNKVNAYTRYVRGVCYTEGGKLFARQVGADQSAVVTSIKDANCLIVIPPGGQGLKAGEPISVLLLGGVKC
ncbi:gephyrin-like molybdotransferase Glp [Paenibacillus sediminis]|uniref:Molybdopterin molybdenumtransferase n=1 Tax=Paenibacillus sediminis TaxID=664909 RepID=A0ABS4H655_9BACL|nr:gephyrin-like molybdotransferase Glp [Paenibacillus sediminis]MBP1937555.1 molybdopterin molybdotransferase [Paenibacillus sediminis]